MGIGMDTNDLTLVWLETTTGLAKTLANTSITSKNCRIKYCGKGSRVDIGYYHGKIT